MKHVISCLMVAAALLIAGCPSVQQTPVPAGAVWRDAGNGVVEHSASGMQFPSTCGEFIRVGTHQYDAAGLDVRAGYNLSSPSTLIAITVYLSPSPPIRSFGSPDGVVADARNFLANQEFQRTKTEITQAHPGAKSLGEEQVALPQPGYRARFSYSENFAGQVRPVESLLYIFSYASGTWTVKYRITFPADINAQPAIDQFLHNLSWTLKRPTAH